MVHLNENDLINCNNIMDNNAGSYRNIEGDEFKATKIFILDNMDVVW